MFALVAVCLLVLVQCKKTTECVNNKLADLVFTPREIMIVPYDSVNRITFQDSLGDTVSLIPIHPPTSQMLANQENYPKDTSGCIGDFRSQQDVVFLLRGKTDTTFYFKFQLRYSFNMISKTKYFTLFIYNTKNDTYDEQFRADLLFDSISLINQSPVNSSCSVSNLLPSVTLLGIPYYLVFEINVPSAEICKVYYSLIDGVVAYRTRHNILWCLTAKV